MAAIGGSSTASRMSGPAKGTWKWKRHIPHCSIGGWLAWLSPMGVGTPAFPPPPINHVNITCVKGAAYLWCADGGDWVRRALTDLIEGGDIRELFSDSELLELAAAEEEYNRRKGSTDIAGVGGLEDGGRKSVVKAPTACGASFVDKAGGVERADREDEHKVWAALR